MTSLDSSWCSLVPGAWAGSCWRMRASGARAWSPIRRHPPVGTWWPVSPTCRSSVARWTQCCCLIRWRWPPIRTRCCARPTGYWLPRGSSSCWDFGRAAFGDSPRRPRGPDFRRGCAVRSPGCGCVTGCACSAMKLSACGLICTACRAHRAEAWNRPYQASCVAAGSTPFRPAPTSSRRASAFTRSPRSDRACASGARSSGSVDWSDRAFDAPDARYATSRGRTRRGAHARCRRDLYGWGLPRKSGSGGLGGGADCTWTGEGALGFREPHHQQPHGAAGRDQRAAGAEATGGRAALHRLAVRTQWRALVAAAVEVARLDDRGDRRHACGRLAPACTLSRELPRRMRQIVLDTETTGLTLAEGHRIIEIGCVELVNRRHTGRHFHRYLNPERDVDAGAIAVHGLTRERLDSSPRFAEIAAELVEFLRDAELIIHNAEFDVAFIDMELGRLPAAAPASVRALCRVLDTLTLARERHPGQRNNLDALCKRYGIDNVRRDLHGALLDAQLLADVYLAMTG